MEHLKWGGQTLTEAGGQSAQGFRAGRQLFFVPLLHVHFFSFSHVQCTLMSPASKVESNLLSCLFLNVLKRERCGRTAFLCLLISIIHSDKFPGYSVKCFGIGGGNQPVLAPVRTCEINDV